jgi:glutaminyl-tRNA synthetase
LYDLFVDWVKNEEDLDDNRPRQYEFNKLNLNYTLMSKRNLLILVKEGLVNGWDDPRMPTLCGFRRRGYSPESIRNFVDKIGYTTYDALNDFALLESAVREDLNSRATRVSAVINPIKLTITNYPEDKVEELTAINNPERPEDGTHTIEFCNELWIESDDFMEDAPKNYFRLTPGREVRLKNAYIVLCTGCNKDENGNVTEVLCEYIPQTKTGEADANRKVKSTIHWVSRRHCLDAEVRLYDRLWSAENPRDEMAAIREAKNCDALEAMKDGGELAIEIVHDDTSVSVSFRDSGSGMSDEALARLFEPFRTTKKKGTGLGLMISRRIVAAHGGEIAVSSEEGRGTTFTVKLPRLKKRVRELA